MTTTQGPGQIALDAGFGVQQLGRPLPLHSYLWKGLVEKFLKGEPKVLGVMQIIVAIMNFSLGILIMCITIPYSTPPLVSVYSGYMVWGSVMFFISGTLSTVAGIKTTRGLVQGSVGLNIASFVAAITGIIVTAMSLAVFSYSYYYYCSVDEGFGGCFFILGLDGVVILLSVLEFCIAVSLSVFGCKVTCCNPGGVVLIVPSNPQGAEKASPIREGGLVPPTGQDQNIP